MPHTDIVTRQEKDLLYSKRVESAVTDRSFQRNGTFPPTYGRQAALSALENMDNELRRGIVAYANRHDMQTGLLPGFDSAMHQPQVHPVYTHN
jgi:hypothetical protein